MLSKGGFLEATVNKTQQRLDEWCSGEGIDFVSEEAKEAYKNGQKELRTQSC